ILTLDPPANRDDQGRLSQVDRLLCLLELLFRLSANIDRRHIDRECFDSGGRLRDFGQVRPVRANLKGCKRRRGGGDPNVSRDLSLKDLATEYYLTRIDSKTNA